MLEEKKGFTTIELLIVVAIIAFLATFLFFRYSIAQKESRDTKRLADMQALSKAIITFHAENGHYPDLSDGLPFEGEILDGTSKFEEAIEPYIKSIAVDPLHDGTDYFYSYQYHRLIDECDGVDPSDKEGPVLAFHTVESTTVPIEKQVCLDDPFLINQHESDYNIGFSED